MIRIEGNCPMGCGPTLQAEESRAEGTVICMAMDCPEPLAAHRILADSESEHIVRFDGGGFTIRHPLRERLGDELMDCGLYLYCISLPGPPGGRPGTFRISESDGHWRMERLATDLEADTP